MSFSGSFSGPGKTSLSKTSQCNLMSCFFNNLPVWLVLVQKMKNAFWSMFTCADKDPNCGSSRYINLCQVSHNIISANEILKVLFSLSPDDRTECFIEKW